MWTEGLPMARGSHGIWNGEVIKLLLPGNRVKSNEHTTIHLVARARNHTHTRTHVTPIYGDHDGRPLAIASACVRAADTRTQIDVACVKTHFAADSFQQQCVWNERTEDDDDDCDGVTPIRH